MLLCKIAPQLKKKKKTKVEIVKWFKKQPNILEAFQQ